MGGVAVDRTIDNIAFRGWVETNNQSDRKFIPLRMIPQDFLDGSCDPICSVDEPSSSYFEANCHGFFTQETGSSIRIPQV